VFLGLLPLKSQGESLVQQLVADPKVGLFDTVERCFEIDEPQLRRKLQHAYGSDDPQATFRGGRGTPILVDEESSRLHFRGERDGGRLGGS
jgi:hypothetical protein